MTIIYFTFYVATQTFFDDSVRLQNKEWNHPIRQLKIGNFVLSLFWLAESASKAKMSDLHKFPINSCQKLAFLASTTLKLHS